MFNNIEGPWSHSIIRQVLRWKYQTGKPRMKVDRVTQEEYEDSEWTKQFLYASHFISSSSIIINVDLSVCLSVCYMYCTLMHLWMDLEQICHRGKRLYQAGFSRVSGSSGCRETPRKMMGYTSPLLSLF